MSNFSPPTIFQPSVFVAIGDSLTAGTSWTPAIQTAFPNIKVVNAGVGGETLAAMGTRYTPQVHPWFSSERVFNICFIWGGANDLTAGASLATMQTRANTLINAAIADGAEPMLPTLTPSTLWVGATDTIRLNYNAWLLSTYPGYAIDFAGISALSNPANTTYYSDGLHLTAAGYALTNPLVIAAITALPPIWPVIGTPPASVGKALGGVFVTSANNAVQILPAADIYFDSGGIQWMAADGTTVLAHLNHIAPSGSLGLNINAGSIFSVFNSANQVCTFRATTSGTYGADAGVGISGTMVGIGGGLFYDLTQTGNVGAGEDTLQTYTLTGQSLFTDGDALEFYAVFTIANNANAKNIKLKFGGATFFDSGAITISAAINIFVRGIIERSGGSTQRISGTVTTDSATYGNKVFNTTGVIDLSANAIVLATGTAVSNDDIVKNSFRLRVLRGKAL